jgi:hypothetical protein
MAKETAKIALAPNFDLHHPYSLEVPSKVYTINSSNFL